MPAANPLEALIETAPLNLVHPEDGACDLDDVRIPHIAIHVFRETDEFADVWARAAVDRRMVSTTTTVYDGGFPAAINKYTKETTPDLLIIETDSSEEILEYETDALAEVCDPGTELIVVGHKNDIALYQKLLNMGVSNYMVYPVTISSIIQAVSQVYREPGKEKIGKIHAVIGAKGGAGSSTVAQNLAMDLAMRQTSEVLLVDLDLSFGSASLNLDVDPNQGLLELVEQSDRLDPAMLDRVLVKRGLYLNLLGAAHVLDYSRGIDLEGIERILDVAASHIPHTVLDIPQTWSDWVERALIAADSVVVVSTPELASLRNAQTLMTQLGNLRPNDRPPNLVLNQVGMRRRQEISARDVNAVLKIDPMVSINFDPKLFSKASTRGKMIAELGRGGHVAKAFTQIAEKLAPRASNVPAAASKRRRRK